MDWVSFDEIKTTVSLEAVIHHYGIPLRPVGANTLRGKCPLPTHSSKESRESFTVTLNRGIGGAWACQSQSCIKARGRIGGNVLDFVAAMEKCSVRDAAIKLQLWFLVPAAGQAHPPEKQNGSKPQLVAKGKSSQPTGQRETNQPLAFALKSIDSSHPYLKDRGLTEETVKTFGVGYFSGKGSMEHRIVIPIHNGEGELLAYAGRSLDRSEPRYKFPMGFKKSLELFNLHRVNGAASVVLCEGFFDCMIVTQAGFPCVALMGSTMSDAQQNLLAPFKKLVLMLDGDEAGRNATKEIATKLIYEHDVRAISLADNIQPDSLSVEAIKHILEPIL